MTASLPLYRPCRRRRRRRCCPVVASFWDSCSVPLAFALRSDRGRSAYLTVATRRNTLHLAQKLYKSPVGS